MKKIKKYIKELCSRKITQIIKKNEVELISAELSAYCLLLLDPSLIMSGGISGYFRQLVQSSKRSTVCGCLLQPWLVLTVLPCWFFISTRHKGGSSNVRQHHMYHFLLSREGFWCNQEAVIPGYPLRRYCSVSGKMVGVFPHPCTTHLGLSQIICIKL